MTSLQDAEAWYTKLLGGDVEKISPVPGIVELKATEGVWLQLVETDDVQKSGAVVRFLVDDMALTQARLLARGISTGEAITVPDVVTYSEFTDPFGNGLGFYDLP